MSQKYCIASLKHTGKLDEHITWWGKDHRGYTPVVGDYLGEYALEDAVKLNDGLDHLAVPVEVVKALASPEPYWKPGARFYDQRGQVLDNTRAVWDQLIAASLQEGRHCQKPKPSIHRGARRSFAWAPEPRGFAGYELQRQIAAKFFERNLRAAEDVGAVVIHDEIVFTSQAQAEQFAKRVVELHREAYPEVTDAWARAQSTPQPSDSPPLL